jgi:hypothetical protein
MSPERIRVENPEMPVMRVAPEKPGEKVAPRVVPEKPEEKVVPEMPVGLAKPEEKVALEMPVGLAKPDVVRVLAGPEKQQPVPQVPRPELVLPERSLEQVLPEVRPVLRLPVQALAQKPEVLPQGLGPVLVPQRQARPLQVAG